MRRRPQSSLSTHSTTTTHLSKLKWTAEDNETNERQHRRTHPCLPNRTAAAHRIFGVSGGLQGHLVEQPLNGRFEGLLVGAQMITSAPTLLPS